MTRDEAIKRLMTRPGYVGLDSAAPTFVDALIALDILKVESQEAAMRAEAHDRLQKIMVEVVNGGGLTGKSLTGVLSSYGAGCILAGLEAAGFKITR
jgi:hypothetical protein